MSSNSSLKDQILEAMQFSDYKSYFQQELGDVGKLNSAGWCVCHCPFHEDKHPSLNVNFFKEGAYRCMACGETGDIFTFHQKRHGIDFKETLKYFADWLGINPEAKPKKAKTKKKRKKLGMLVAIYQYKDINGKIIFETCKYQNPKDFRQRRPHPTKEGQYIWNLKGVEIIPYNLKAVIENDIIYIVEGEKDADRLTQIGLTATCNPMGAGKWNASLTPYFKGKTVIILPDNDDPGHKHAELVATRLKGIAKSIQVVKLPNLKEHGDVSDWLADGNTKSDLLELVNKSKPYEDHIDFFNKHHAVVMIGGKCCILNEYIDPIFNRPAVTFSGISDFKNRYMNRMIPNPNAYIKGQPKMIYATTDWLKSPNRREYDNIVFSPGKTPNGCYNLWKGFAIEPKKGDWSGFRNHIFEIIADSKQDIFDWIMTWLAKIVQDPGGKRPGTSLVLRGGQGIGKGFFVSNFGKIFGNHYMQINNQKQLTSRFNSHLKDVLFLFIDEGFWAGDKSSEGVIKGIITEDLIMMEAKGKDAFPIKNHVRMIMASNNDWIAPSGLDERRFLTIDVSESRKQDKAYFNALSRELKNGGLEAMLYDMLEYDTTKVDVGIIVRTTAVFDQIIESMTPIQKFWFEKLRLGQLQKSDGDDWFSGDIMIPVEVLYNQYLDFCDKIGVRYKEINIQFGKKIRKICPGLNRKKQNVMSDSAENYVQRWFYHIPRLEICRNSFENIVKIDIDWDNDLIFRNGVFE